MAGTIITFSWHRKGREDELPGWMGRVLGQVEIFLKLGNKIKHWSEMNLYWKKAKRAVFKGNESGGGK